VHSRALKKKQKGKKLPSEERPMAMGTSARRRTAAVLLVAVALIAGES